MKATILFLLGALTPVWAASPFAFRETGTGSVELLEKGKPVYVYNYGMQLKEGVPESMRRCCYLSPVYTPDGVVVTDDFPKDHFHHRGIFWSWPVVKVGGNTYDAWAVKSASDRFVRWLVRDENAGGKARLKVENGWFVGDKKIIRETVEILTRKANQGRRELDITLTFEALDEPVAIAGQQNGKGYGGFSIRFAPRESTVVRTEAGSEAKATDLVPHPWAELEGTYAGNRAVTRVDIGQSNPAYPDGWCLRHYGFLGVNFPGLEPFTIEPGKPLVLKYRVTVSGPK